MNVKWLYLVVVFNSRQAQSGSSISKKESKHSEDVELVALQIIHAS